MRNGQPLSAQREVEAFSSFLRPADDRDFEELIRDIAQAEQEENAHGPDLQRVERMEQTRELRRSVDWRPGSVPKGHPRT